MIALVRFAPKLGACAKNLSTIEWAVKNAAEKGAELVVFPEMIVSGYQLENLVSESALLKNSADWSGLLKLSSHTEIVIGCPIRQNSNFYNSMVVLREGRIAHVYHKMYLPTYGMFDEARYFSAGEKLGIYDGKLGATGLLICEDAWHPALAYAVHAAKPDLILVPSASPARGLSVDDKHHSARMWQSRLSIYAESFGTAFFYVNISGSEDGVRYGGEAFMAAPGGEIRFGQSLIENEVQFSFFSLTDADFSSSATTGGPWQNESHAKNLDLILQAKNIREQKNA
ncbi:MAG: hypothetical protein KDK41_02890 [Leptospiraceae bacterium]|nr:hypothetical protein [Leptospiraceae bacterium]MCB1199567.1 hypothetical protein [Leptospiraceae bacterium]